MFKTKDCGLEIKDIDLTKRKVSGYFAAFGNVDSDGDMFMPGAFKKSIKENGPNSSNPRIAHLLQHSVYDPIGKIVELEEDSKGVRFTSQVSESTKGRDALILYQEEIYREHSVGFQTINEHQEEGFNGITEVKLWEGSTVTFGANSQTPVTAIKSKNKKEAAEHLHERMTKLANILRKGEGLTDGTFQNLAIELEQIKTLYNSLLTQEPPSTPKAVEPDLIIQGFTNAFKLN